MGFEILEHTADVGIRATAGTVEGCFEQATLGLCDIMGIWRPGGEGEGTQESIELSSDDLGALLVDWLGEVLFVHEVRNAWVRDLEVASVADGTARGSVTLAPITGEVEGTQVKAVTYHQLRVQQTEHGWEAEVFLDV